MAHNAVERQRPIVEFLEVDPDETLLEIGCGHGYAVSLICEQLQHGTITAIDRSDVMIRMATKKNAAWVEAGKATFQQMTLAQADFGNQRFDTIFAVNVNLFWIKAAAELKVIRGLLAEEGRLCLFYQPPSAGQVDEILEKVGKMLAATAFEVVRTKVMEGEGFRTVCIVGKAGKG